MLKKKMLNAVSLMLLLIVANNAFALPTPGKPIEPFRIASNLYFIGNTYVASYLIVTPKGNILINSDFEEDVPMLESNIKKLGFNFKDTKILLISHAHNDHAGGSALIKEKTGAKYMVMDADVSVVESGGKDDFHYGSSSDPDNFYPPVKVDKILHDGDTIKLGRTQLVAYKTGGHTKGCTTFTMTLRDKGKSYETIIVGGPYVNPGYKLVNNKSYPNIAKDYAHTFEVLKSLPVDIFLGAHGVYFDLHGKLPMIKKGHSEVLFDPDGYMNFVLRKEKDFQLELKKQKEVG